MCIKVECTACGLGKGGDLLALAAALSLCWEQKIRGDGRGGNTIQSRPIQTSKVFLTKIHYCPTALLEPQYVWTPLHLVAGLFDAYPLIAGIFDAYPKARSTKMIAGLFDAYPLIAGLFYAYPKASSTKMIAGLFDGYSLLEIGTYMPSSVDVN